MRLNGLYIVVEMAVRKLGDPLVTRYKKPLILGSLREDVWYIPGARFILEHLSFSHFYRPPLPGGIVPFLWPGPRYKANLFYGRALDAQRAGRTAAAFVQLGRVAHLITDMACPVHAHRTMHETDPFEWWVEGNKKRLLALDVPDLFEGERASDFIEGMARYTQAFRTDATNHLPGRLLKKLGLREPVRAKEAGEQAMALIPMAAAYTASFLRLFVRQSGAA
jgi:hypothetical protein